MVIRLHMKWHSKNDYSVYYTRGEYSVLFPHNTLSQYLEAWNNKYWLPHNLSWGLQLSCWTVLWSTCSLTGLENLLITLMWLLAGFRSRMAPGLDLQLNTEHSMKFSHDSLLLLEWEIQQRMREPSRWRLQGRIHIISHGPILMFTDGDYLSEGESEYQEVGVIGSHCRSWLMQIIIVYIIYGILQAKYQSHFLLQGIFLTQGSNPRLLHWQADSLPLAPTEKSHLYYTS